MNITRRTLLTLFTITAATSGAQRLAPFVAPTPALSLDASPHGSAPTPLKRFLESRGIKPAHLSRESGYSRRHLLRIRLGRIEPTPHCAAAITTALRRLSGEPVAPSDLFAPAIAARAAALL